MNNKKLKKPPIIEAIIGIALSKPIYSLETLESLYKSNFSDIFAKKETRKNFIAHIDINTNAFKSDGREMGLKLSTDPKDLTLFLEINRLSLSKLAPYESGESLLKQYKGFWNTYIEKYEGEINIQDIASRSINRFVLPIDKLGLFAIKPVMLSENLILFGNYAGQYIIISSRFNAKAIINVNTKPLENKKVEITFDIDAHNVINVKYNNFESDIESIFMRLREFKNDIFFSNLPKANIMEEFQ